MFDKANMFPLFTVIARPIDLCPFGDLCFVFPSGTLFVHKYMYMRKRGREREKNRKKII